MFVFYLFCVVWWVVFGTLLRCCFVGYVLTYDCFVLFVCYCFIVVVYIAEGSVGVVGGFKFASVVALLCDLVGLWLRL